MPVLAHGGRPDEVVAEILLLVALVLAWPGVTRLRGRGFARMPRGAAWGLVAGAGGVLLVAVLVPTIIWRDPAPAAVRPASTAVLVVAAPVEGQQVSGAFLDVVTELTGATVVEASSTEVRPDTGHVHVSVDGQLMSMAYAPEQRIPIDQLERGPHVLRVEFVAADHAPFDPPVVTTVTFVTLTA